MSTKNNNTGSRKRRATGENERSGSDGDDNGPPTAGASNKKYNNGGEQMYSTHDPACDACRFKKIKCDRETPSCLNCSRGELRCVYSDRGKRTNYTKRLIEDLGDVSSRLERLEDAVERCVSMVEGIAIGSSETGSSANLLDFHGRESPSQSPDSRRRSDSEDSRYILKSEDGNEKYHGSSSMVQLFRRAQSAMDTQLKTLPGGDNMSDAELTLRLSSIGDVDMHRNAHVDLSHDKLPLSRPPKGLLDALIEPYFQQTNPVFPIFGRDSFLSSIDQNYAIAGTQIDSAWVLAFNNVTLQSLSAKSRSTRKDHEQPHLSAMDAELIKPFLVNSRRAFACTDILLKPRLINVQALLSFCLVALDNFQIETAELLLEQACQVARSMGLHQQARAPEGLTMAEVQERRNVFWTLSVLDKHFSILTGKSCCLPSYDCDVNAPEPEPENRLQRYFLARIGLAMIQERVYVSLYSAKAMRKSDAQIQTYVSRLDLELRQWFEGISKHIEEAKKDVTTSECVLATELEFLYYNTCIMIHRRSRSQQEKAQCLNEARQSLDLLQLLKMNPRVEKDAALRRCFQMYPFAAFSEVFSNLTKNPSPGSTDLQALNGSLAVLRDVASTDNQGTYCSKLYAATSRCAAMAAEFVQRSDPSPQPVNPSGQRAPMKRRITTPPKTKTSISSRTSPERTPPMRSPPLRVAEPNMQDQQLQQQHQQQQQQQQQQLQQQQQQHHQHNIKQQNPPSMAIDVPQQALTDHYFQIPHARNDSRPISPNQFDKLMSTQSFDSVHNPMMANFTFDPSNLMHENTHYTPQVEFHQDGEDRLSPFTMGENKDDWMSMSMQPVHDNMFESWAVNDQWTGAAL